MFTLCPQCESVHALDAAALAQDRGQVRCGHCGETFDALPRLWDHYPDGRTPPAQETPAEAPPELGGEDTLAEVLPAQDPPPGAAPVRWPWLLLVAILTLATLFNLGWAFRDQLPRDGGLAAWLHERSVPGFAPEAAYRDPSRMHLVTRDIHPHPTRPGVLVLSATFVNMGDQAQAFPQLAVTLFDRNNQPIAARLFRPADYLRQAPGPEQLLAPDEHVPLLLEFADPDQQATGFDLQFR